MIINSATATAHPNIALIKYWGDIDSNLHLPTNGSISINLAELTTRTEVSFDDSLEHDQLLLNGEEASGSSLERVSAFLAHVRSLTGISTFACVESINDFPTGVGIASSASGFAALSLAATRAAGLSLGEVDLSRLARSGSGSACRSIPTGFVEWQAGTTDMDSYAHSIAPPEHWDIVDCIALVSHNEKHISSTRGHALASTSLLQAARVADAPRRLDLCRAAILNHDFHALSEIVELDCNLMHAVMMTSVPPLVYWQPETLAVIHAVISWTKEGLPVCYTIDAGPNVHVLCPEGAAEQVIEHLQSLPEVSQVLVAHPGGPAYLTDNLKATSY